MRNLKLANLGFGLTDKYPLVYLPKSYLEKTKIIKEEYDDFKQNDIKHFPFNNYYHFNKNDNDFKTDAIDEIRSQLVKKEKVPIKPSTVIPPKPSIIKNPIKVIFGINSSILYPIVYSLIFFWVGMICCGIPLGVFYRRILGYEKTPALPLFLSIFVFILIVASIAYLKKRREVHEEFIEEDKDYPVLLEKQRISLEEYKLKLKQYQEYEHKYNKYIHQKKHNLHQTLDILLRSKIKDNLKAILLPNRDSSTVKRGHSEVSFLENHLLPEFHDKIKLDMRLGSFSNPFCPDFVYAEDGLFIDIEIDESYDFLSKKPIHYIDGSDDERNDFFLQNNWFIVRFAEEQIKNDPDGCIEFIKHFVRCLKSFNINDIKYGYSKGIRRWTYEESFLYAKNNSRE
jgi:hypothetical protein